MSEQNKSGSVSEDQNSLHDGAEVVVLTYERRGQVITEHLIVGDKANQVKAVFLSENAEQQAPADLKRETTPANPAWRKRSKTPKPRTGKEKEPRDMHLNCYWVGGVLYCD